MTGRSDQRSTSAARDCGPNMAWCADNSLGRAKSASRLATVKSARLKRSPTRYVRPSASLASSQSNSSSSFARLSRVLAPRRFQGRAELGQLQYLPKRLAKPSPRFPDQEDRDHVEACKPSPHHWVRHPRSLEPTTSHPRSLLSIARLNSARSLKRFNNWSRVLIAQTCFGRRGGLAPVSLPLFQG
jgi:hypothetical protein